MEFKLLVDLSPNAYEAIKVLGTALGAVTKQTTAPTVAATKKAKKEVKQETIAESGLVENETTPVDAKEDDSFLDPSDTKEITYSMDDVIAALRVVNNEKSPAAAKAVLAKFGVKSVRELKQSDYAACMKACRG